MAQISNVSAVNLENVLDKNLRKAKRIKIKKYRKKRSGIKRKDNLYFKRKRLIRSLILRKRLLKMSDGEGASSLVHMSGTRWQQEDEIAFWKARAVSLEYENKMLHKHIKQMYIGMISQRNQATSDYTEYEEQYDEDYKENEELLPEESSEHSGEIYYDCEQEQQEDIDDEEFNKESKEFRRKRDEERAKAKKKVDSEDEEESKPPEEQLSKIREKQMKKMYGEAWRKIMGMETAIQLNHDLTVEKDNVKYWPCLPINM